MQWLKTISGEVLSLFVDDGKLAIAIVVWLGIAWMLSTQGLSDLYWSGVVLFIGLVVILIESALRRAQQ